MYKPMIKLSCSIMIGSFSWCLQWQILMLGFRSHSKKKCRSHSFSLPFLWFILIFRFICPCYCEMYYLPFISNKKWWCFCDFVYSEL